MEMVAKLERHLAKVYQKMPPLPARSQETLVLLWPWLALMFGVLQLVAAWVLWRLTRFIDTSNLLLTYYGGRSVVSGFDRLVMYAGVVVLVVSATMLLVAFRPLAGHQKRGWELLFLGLVANVLYALVSLFIVGRGVGSSALTLLGSVVGFYLLFQVKTKFGGRSSSRNSSR